MLLHTINSFIHPSIHPFIRSFIISINQSIKQASNQSIHPSIDRSIDWLIYWFTHSFISFISFVHSFHFISFIHFISFHFISFHFISFIHSFIHSFNPLLITRLFQMDFSTWKCSSRLKQSYNTRLFFPLARLSVVLPNILKSLLLFFDWFLGMNRNKKVTSEEIESEN